MRYQGEVLICGLFVPADCGGFHSKRVSSNTVVVNFLLLTHSGNLFVHDLTCVSVCARCVAEFIDHSYVITIDWWNLRCGKHIFVQRS